LQVPGQAAGTASAPFAAAALTPSALLALALATLRELITVVLMVFPLYSLSLSPESLPEQDLSWR